jgi:putative Ca2+/H+ antiporter (TMEM165/GDT1 family)
MAMATICAGASWGALQCRCAVVAAGDYVRTKTPLRSVFALTSIAPTRAAIASVAMSSLLELRSRHRRYRLACNFVDVRR